MIFETAKTIVNNTDFVAAVFGINKATQEKFQVKNINSFNQSLPLFHLLKLICFGNRILDGHFLSVFFGFPYLSMSFQNKISIA